jgi:hypothetical protein
MMFRPVKFESCLLAHSRKLQCRSFDSRGTDEASAVAICQGLLSNRETSIMKLLCLRCLLLYVFEHADFTLAICYCKYKSK